MSSVIQTLSGAIATPYQANITVPNWMLGSMERVMQYYVDKNLRLDTLSAEMMPAPVEGKKYMLYAHIPFCHNVSRPPNMVARDSHIVVQSMVRQRWPVCSPASAMPVKRDPIARGKA